jgi:hypothetical protein
MSLLIATSSDFDESLIIVYSLDLDAIGPLDSIHSFIAPCLDDDLESVARGSWLCGRSHLHLLKKIERHITGYRE